MHDVVHSDSSPQWGRPAAMKTYVESDATREARKGAERPDRAAQHEVCGRRKTLPIRRHRNRRALDADSDLRDRQLLRNLGCRIAPKLAEDRQQPVIEDVAARRPQLASVRSLLRTSEAQI